MYRRIATINDDNHFTCDCPLRYALVKRMYANQMVFFLVKSMYRLLQCQKT